MGKGGQWVPGPVQQALHNFSLTLPAEEKGHSLTELRYQLLFSLGESSVMVGTQ